MSARGATALLGLLLCACGAASKPSAAGPTSTASSEPRDDGTLQSAFERARKHPQVFGKEKNERRELDEISALLDLRPRVLDDPALLQRLDAELLGRRLRLLQSQLFPHMRLHDPRAPEIVRRYGAWMAGNLRSWNPAMQVVAVAALFPPVFVDSSSEPRWPGVDRSALAWQLIDAYRNAPPGARDQDPAHDAATFLLCSRGERGPRHRRNSSCKDEFLRYSLETEQRRGELAGHLIERDDPALTAMLLRAMPAVETRSNAVQLQLTQALEPAKRAWLAAMQALAESERSYDDPKTAPDLVSQVQEAQRIWVHSANDVERRGVALYLLANLDRQDRGYVAWPRFAQQFGSPIQPAELAAFLNVEPARAMQLLHVVVPALASRATPADAFARATLPALQRYLTASDDERGSRGGEYETMNELIGALCLKKRQADTRTLGAALGDYEKAQHTKMFGDLSQAWRERDCRAPSTKGPKVEAVELPAPREVPEAPRNQVKLVPIGVTKGTQQVELQPSRSGP